MDCSVKWCTNPVSKETTYCDDHQIFIGATLSPMKSKKSPTDICGIRDCNRKATKVAIITMANGENKTRYKIRVCSKHKKSDEKFFVKAGTEAEAVGGEVSMRNMAVKFLPKFAWESILVRSIYLGITGLDVVRD
jgi:hypothetical protein